MAVRPRSERGRGRHFLRSSKLATDLVLAAGIEAGDLVLDVGAGSGVLTAALARRGARVVAIEIDRELAAGLRRRFPGIDVRQADACTVRLPRAPFKVVANLPFAGATAILRRLLDPAGQLACAEVIVEWGFAQKRTAVWPNTELAAYWGAWFDLAVARRLSRSAFAPPPATDAGVLHVTRRANPLVHVEDRAAYAAFLARGYRHGVRAAVPWRLLKRLEPDLGFDRNARPRDLDTRQWTELFARAVRPRL